MSLFNFIKPKWQHSNPAVRLAALSSSACPDRDQLALLVCNDTDQSVRRAALAKIDDWRFLSSLMSDPDAPPSHIDEIQSRINALQLGAVFNGQSLEDKEQALLEIHSEVILLRIASEESSKPIRLLAAERIQQEQKLVDLVATNCGKEVSVCSVDRITQPELLEVVVRTASSRAARVLASKKLSKLSEDKAAAQREYFEQKTSPLLDRLKVLPMLSDIDGAYRQAEEIHKEWVDLGVPETYPDYAEFFNIFTQVNQRYETYLSQSDEERIKLAKLPERLDRLSSIDASILSEAESLDTTSAQQRYESFKAEWRHIADDLDEIPKQVIKRFNQGCRQFEERQAEVSEEQVSFDRFLKQLHDLAARVGEHTIVQSQKELMTLGRELSNWRPQYVLKEELDSLASSITDKITCLVAEAEEAREREIEENISDRRQLIAGIEQLMAQDLKEAEAAFLELKDRWARLDDCRGDLATCSALDVQYKKVCAQYLEYRSSSYQNIEWQQWQNKNLKSQLIDEMRQLGQENDLHQVFKKLKSLQQQWRTIGPVGPKESEKLWKKFQVEAERNFARCREFFSELEALEAQNAEQKYALIEKARTLSDSSEWKKTAELLKALQEQWKKIGKAPIDQETKLYQDFREACDQFFSRRQEHFAELDAVRQENLDKKSELCERVEKLVAKPDLSKKDRLIELQKQWKAIGPVPRESEEAIWSRFRGACDSFYMWLDTLKPDNLEKKEKLCLEAENLCLNLPDLSDQKKVQEFAGLIGSLQKQWKNIGPVPDEQSEPVWQRFREACDTFFKARGEYFETLDAARPANEAMKFEILKQLDEIVQIDSSKTVKEIVKLQEDWKNIGPASKKNDFAFERRFNETCNTFFKARRQVFEEMDRIRRENLKQKEALCVRLELLAGVAVPEIKATTKKKSSLTLAEQLQLAFEQNFIMAGDDKDKSRRKKDELGLILAEWNQIGPVPKEHEFSLQKRYKRALVCFRGPNR